MYVIDDEERDLIDLGPGVKGQGNICHFVYKAFRQDTDHSLAQTLSNFTCKLLMRGGTLLFFGHGLIVQAHIWYFVHKPFRHNTVYSTIKNVNYIYQIFGGYFSVSAQ